MSASSYAGSVPGAIGGFQEEDDDDELELDDTDSDATVEYCRIAERAALLLNSLDAIVFR